MWETKLGRGQLNWPRIFPLVALWDGILGREGPEESLEE